MITICTRWESSQMPAELEWRMWRQLRGAFGINRFVFTPIIDELLNVAIDQYPTMEEALVSCPGVKVFLEPNGDKWPSDLVQVKDVTYDLILVLGNTPRGNKKLIGSDDYSIRLNESGRSHLYGTNAAAIALAYWTEK